MNTITNLQEYKHNIPGKFNDIKTALEDLSESNINEPLNVEILLEVHRMLLKMVQTSKFLLDAHSGATFTINSEKSFGNVVGKIDINSTYVNIEKSNSGYNFSCSKSEISISDFLPLTRD